jgi:hypothetical protein
MGKGIRSFFKIPLWRRKIRKIVNITDAIDRDRDGVNDDIGWYCWLKSEGY